MGVETSSANDVAAGRREDDLADTSQHGAGKKNGGPYLFGELRGDFVLDDVVGGDREGVGSFADHGGPEVAKNVEHDQDVLDFWNVRQPDGFGSQKACGDAG